jgi:linoleoyl-CoA desaturase
VGASSDQISQRVAFGCAGQFTRTVRERVTYALQAAERKGDPRLKRKSLLILIWFSGSFILLLRAHSIWLDLALWFSYGLASSAAGFNIFHDANHGTMFASRRINSLVAFLTSAALGPSRYLWSYKHHILHHRFTNIEGWDDDLETRGFLRLSPQQTWKSRYVGQHIFAFALYAISALEMVFVKDFVQYFTLRMNPHQSIPAMSNAEKIEFWAAKIIYLTVFVALPIALLPFGYVVAGFLIYEATLGLSLALVFGMAHQVELAEFSATSRCTPVIAEEWAAHQMRTTVNFANSSPAWNWFSGGLNHQIEHHLFPSISHTHYPDIRKLVRDTALEFHLPYHHFGTHTEALTSHYRFLRKLGARPLPR